MYRITETNNVTGEEVWREVARLPSKFDVPKRAVFWVYLTEDIDYCVERI